MWYISLSVKLKTGLCLPGGFSLTDILGSQKKNILYFTCSSNSLDTDKPRFSLSKKLQHIIYKIVTPTTVFCCYNGLIVNHAHKNLLMDMIDGMTVSATGRRAKAASYLRSKQLESDLLCKQITVLGFFYEFIQLYSVNSLTVLDNSNNLEPCE